MIRPPTVQRTWQIPELPRRLEHHQLIAAWNTQVLAGKSRNDPGRRCVPIGIGGDEALALGLDLDTAPITLIVGPPGSGRTGVLRCIADGLARLGEPMLWVSLAGDPARIPVEPAGTASTLASALIAHPTSTVLVDDTQVVGIPGSTQEGLEDLLISHLGAGPLVVACSAPELLGAYRGLLSVARTARSGILLGPSRPGDAEVFGLRTERRPPGPPGRALLIQRGSAVSVQLALPPPLDQLGPGAQATQAAQAGYGGETARSPHCVAVRRLSGDRVRR